MCKARFRAFADVTMSYGFPPVPIAWHLWCALALASALVAAFVALLAYVVAD